MSSRSRNVIDLKKGATPRVKEREAPRSSTIRPARLKTRRRQQRIVNTLACLLGAVGVVGALGAVSHLHQLAVADVSVTGAKLLSVESVVAAVKDDLNVPGFHLFSRKNILLYPKRSIESGLSTDFPRIKEVSVARESLLASAVVVTVEERAPYATWCKGDACYVFDSSGFIFAEKTETPEKSYVFYGGLLPDTSPVGQTFLEGRLSNVIALLDSLGAVGYAAQGFSVDSEKDFTVVLSGGQKLYASFDISTEQLLRNLTTTLEAEALKDKFETLEYIDLRFGNKVYYK